MRPKQSTDLKLPGPIPPADPAVRAIFPPSLLPQRGDPGDRTVPARSACWRYDHQNRQWKLTNLPGQQAAAFAAGFVNYLSAAGFMPEPSMTLGQGTATLEVYDKAEANDTTQLLVLQSEGGLRYLISVTGLPGLLDVLGQLEPILKHAPKPQSPSIRRRKP